MKLLVVDASVGFNRSGWLAARWAGHLRRRGIDAAATLPNDPDGLLRRVYAAEGVPVLGPTVSLEPDTVALFTTAAARTMVQQVGRPARSIWLIRDGHAGLVSLAAPPGIDRLWETMGALVFHDGIQPRDIFAPFLRTTRPDRVHIVPPGVDLPQPEAVPPPAEGALRVAAVGTIGPASARATC